MNAPLSYPMLVDASNGHLGFVLPHSLMGDPSAVASKQGAVSGQFSDIRLTMKGQDAGRRSSNIAEMLSLGKAPHFQIETRDGVTDDFLKHENNVDADAPRADTAMLRHFSSDIAGGAAVLKEVAAMLKSGDGAAISIVSQITVLMQALSDPSTPQAKIETIMQAIADLSKDNPQILAQNKALNKMLHTLAAQALEAFPSATIEAVTATLTKPHSPADLLDQSIEAVIDVLKSVAADETLSDALREEADAMIAELEAMPEGQPVPIEVFQRLQAMGEALEGTEYGEPLLAASKRMRSANIILKSQKFGLTVAEIHKMETLVSDLGTIAHSNENKANKGVKAVLSQVKRSIRSLDSNPLSVAAFAGLSVIAPVMASPAIQAQIVSPTTSIQAVQQVASSAESVTQIQQPIITQAPLNSPQGEALKQTLAVPESIAAIESNFESEAAPSQALVTDATTDVVLPVQPEAGPVLVDTLAPVQVTAGTPTDVAVDTSLPEVTDSVVADKKADASNLGADTLGEPVITAADPVNDPVVEQSPLPVTPVDIAPEAEVVMPVFEAPEASDKPATDSVAQKATAKVGKAPPPPPPPLDDIQMVHTEIAQETRAQAEQIFTHDDNADKVRMFNQLASETGMNAANMNAQQKLDFMNQVMKKVQDTPRQGCPPGCVCPDKFAAAARNEMKNTTVKPTVAPVPPEAHAKLQP